MTLNKNKPSPIAYKGRKRISVFPLKPGVTPLENKDKVRKREPK